MIYTFVPYSEKRPPDLGQVCNKFMELLPNNDDWACLIDHDIMFTRRDWFHQLNDIIKKHPEYGCFVAMTNRIGSPWQKRGKLENSNDIREHRKLGELIQKAQYNEVIPPPHRSPFSGFLILIKKAAWEKVKFGNGYDGLCGVDNQFHKRLKHARCRVGLMLGVYVYHYGSND